MSGFPLANFTGSDRGLFSTAEIQELMRIEHDRAARYGYPVALLLIEIDRLEYLHDLYGVESQQEILESVVSLLGAETRDSDFVGCLDDDRVMALFPHTPTEGASALAARFLRASKRLTFESDGRSLRATLSIGVSCTEPSADSTFEQLVETTVEALRFAVVEGGDRFVLRQPASVYFEELRQELEEEARLLGEEQLRLEFEGSMGQMPAAQAAPLPTASDLQKDAFTSLPETGPGLELVAERIHDLFAALDVGAAEHSEQLDRLELQMIALAQASIEEARQTVMLELAGDQANKVDVLERRVSKLKELLDTTEAELLRIARMKGVDTGVASIYKTVQGLSAEEDEFKRKKEMLTLLFEANVELRKQIKDKP